MFGKVFVGGTFDRLHSGHKSLLTRAFGYGEDIVIGVTSDTYVRTYKKGDHKPFEERKQSLEEWLKRHGFAGRASIISIDDPHEPAASMDIHAIVVTAQNKGRGDDINTLRIGKGLTPLSFIEVPLISAEDGMPISSSRVRHGEIDPKGHLIMPEFLRTTLNQPFGVLHTGHDVSHTVRVNAKKTVLTVGDMATKTVLDKGVMPALAVIDLYVGRKPFLRLDQYRFPDGAVMMETVSGPGYISHDAREKIRLWSHDFRKTSDSHTVIVVKGEEDLFVLPVLIHAPLGAIVYYGQPELTVKGEKSKGEPVIHLDEGLVEVVVTETVRQRAISILAEFVKEL